MSKAVTKETVQTDTLNGKPTIIGGMKLHGLPMRQYEEWAECKSVLMLRQSTLPVFYTSLPFLDALLAMDKESIQQTGMPAGWLFRAIKALSMALRMDDDAVEKRSIEIIPDETETKINSIRVRMNGEEKTINKSLFQRMRQIILWQQGDEMPDESLNDELLEAEQDIARQNAPHLQYSLIDLKASIACELNIRIKDIQEFSILEFETMRRAIDRSKKHMICAIAEGNGAKWKGGNPHPSWCYDKETTQSGALIAPGDFGKSKKS